MSDRVMIKVGVDTTEADAKLAAQVEKMDDTALQLTELQRQVLTTVSQAMGIINQSYGVLKQFVQRAGSIIDPLFDALFQMVSSVVSTAISAALLLSATGNPALLAIGLSLLVLSLELQLKTQLELANSKGQLDAIFANMQRQVSPQSLRGVSF